MSAGVATACVLAIALIVALIWIFELRKDLRVAEVGSSHDQMAMRQAETARKQLERELRSALRDAEDAPALRAILEAGTEALNRIAASPAPPAPDRPAARSAQLPLARVDELIRDLLAVVAAEQLRHPEADLDIAARARRIASDRMRTIVFAWAASMPLVPG